MSRYIATGTAHPERADIHFSPIQMAIGDAGDVSIHCDSSQVTVTMNLLDIDGFTSAHLHAEHLASMVTSALGFSLGSGYSVEMIQIIEENGTPHVFGVRPGDPASGATLAFTDHNSVFGRTLSISGRDIFFRFAVADFVRAIVEPKDCATYCYRSIEAIKSAIGVRTGRESWETMHEFLGTDRGTIDSQVKKFADPVRHGNWIATPSTNGAERYAMLRLTRDILFTYLAKVEPTSEVSGEDKAA